MAENAKPEETIAADRRGSMMVSVRLQATELDAIKRRAAEKDESVSGFIRDAALKASGFTTAIQPIMSSGTGTAANWPVVTSVGSAVIAQISLPGGAALPGPVAGHNRSGDSR